MPDLGHVLIGRCTRELLLASLWFLVVGWINQTQGYVIESIFPYAVPVAVIADRHGLGLGFILAALATLAAAPAQYLETHSSMEVLWAAFETYFKLSCVVMGAIWLRQSLS